MIAGAAGAPTSRDTERLNMAIRAWCRDFSGRPAHVAWLATLVAEQVYDELAGRGRAGAQKDIDAALACFWEAA